MAATIPPTVTAHYLVTLTVPFDVDASTDPNVLTFRAGTPATDVRRLTPAESTAVIAALDQPGTPRFLEETLTPATPTEVHVTLQADATKTVETLRTAARAARAQTTTKKTRKTTTKTRKPDGRRASPASLAINDALRTALAEGKSTQEAAEAAGVTLSSARQRILKHKLRPTVAPVLAESPVGLDKPVVPRVGTPRPTPGPKPGRPVNGNAIALGAKRRIQSLIAIGYSPKGLGQYLPGGSDFTIDDVLGLPDGSEISLAAFAEIDRIWRMKRYSPLPEAVWAPDITRTFPPPGIWANIDDPNEHHGEVA